MSVSPCCSLRCVQPSHHPSARPDPPLPFASLRSRCRCLQLLCSRPRSRPIGAFLACKCAVRCAMRQVNLTSAIFTTSHRRIGMKCRPHRRRSSYRLCWIFSSRKHSSNSTLKPILPAYVTLVSDVDDLLHSIQKWVTSTAHPPVRVRGGHRALSRSGRRLAHLRDRHLLHDSAR
jgi:hypothetical protein